MNDETVRLSARVCVCVTAQACRYRFRSMAVEEVAVAGVAIPASGLRRAGPYM